MVELIPKGRENAVPLSYLIQMSGMDGRHVRSAINRINTEGVDIICCENGKGYYRANTASEAMDYCRYNEAYIRSLSKKNSAIKRTIERKFSGQEVIDFAEQ